MSGKIKLDDIPKVKIDPAIEGYRKAADGAKSAADKAYQEARIRALPARRPQIVWRKL